MILNMSQHYLRIVELKIRLLEEPDEETFLVSHVCTENSKGETADSMIL